MSKPVEIFFHVARATVPYDPAVTVSHIYLETYFFSFMTETIDMID